MMLSSHPTEPELSALGALTPGWTYVMEEGHLRALWHNSDRESLATFEITSRVGYAQVADFILELTMALETLRRNTQSGGLTVAEWVGSLGSRPVGTLLRRFFPGGEVAVRIHQLHSLEAASWFGG